MRQNRAPHGWRILRLQRGHNPRRYEGWSEQTLEHRVESADQSETSRLSRARAWFHAEPRPLALVRPLRSTVRVLHLIAVGALYGGHVYNVSAERLIPALVATLATGGAFVALESYRAPIWLVQVRGGLTLVKIVLVASVALLWDLRVPILTLAVVIGAVGSHMPGDWRYHSLLHGRVVGTPEKG
jgi:hypothetical protein